MSEYAPIVQRIEVPCTPDVAFRIFLQDMHRWWPLARFSVSALLGGESQGLRVEDRVGGTIIELGHDGREHLWGTITELQRPHYLGMDFHIAESPAASSRLELRFTALPGPETRTEVELTQSNWEAFGEKAKMLYGGYAGGWAVIFGEAYAAACAAAAQKP